MEKMPNEIHIDGNAPFRYDADGTKDKPFQTMHQAVEKYPILKSQMASISAQQIADQEGVSGYSEE